MPRKVHVTRFNGFGLGVYNGKAIKNGKIEMANGQVYSIKLENHRDTVAEGVLKIDGEVVGSFLLDPGHRIEIERPVDLSRKFTFYKLNKLPGSKFSKYSSQKNGLIEAIFTPTFPSSYKKTKILNYHQSTYHNGNDGITAFTIPSNQRFAKYNRYNLDTADTTILDIKLVGEQDMDYYYPTYSYPTYLNYNYYPTYNYPTYNYPMYNYTYYDNQSYVAPYIWYDNPEPLYIKPVVYKLY
jgi:hypothetical protein